MAAVILQRTNVEKVELMLPLFLSLQISHIIR